ncbi:fasciclin domain-containing protein, partial [Cribrihabitans sp. XS_ASV171]
PLDLPGNDAPLLSEIIAGDGPLAREDFDLFRYLLSAADLSNPQADLTVFAPSDAGFVRLAQELGYPGDDESGVASHLLRALNLFSAGNPVPLLSEILLTHFVDESLQWIQMAEHQFPTLQGRNVTVDGNRVHDFAANLPDPDITDADILAANGILHVINGVLVPVNVLHSNGLQDVMLHFGDDDAEDTSFGNDNDLIDAGGGNDTIFANAGDDIVMGMGGNDRLLGMEGDDTLRGGEGRDLLNGGQGDDDIAGGGLGDTIVAGAGDDSVSGDGGNDLLYGEGGNDTISGGNGADLLAGQIGDDILSGGALGDDLFGNAGDDFLNGGSGFDRLNGGEGSDRFYHAGTESHGTDWIQD